MSKSSARNRALPVPKHDPIWQDAGWRSRLRRRLASWFQRRSRDLPWRRDPTPYRVWISEIMLQQTQVATVIPYFDRFLKSFPTVEKLADADEQELLSHWEGLGYYRRARSMHAAARRIVDQHDGEFPESIDDVLQLPGIGRYTAGAILSISRGQRQPILEGNTQRVFSRWVAMQGVATESANNKLLWNIAEAMLPRKDPGTFNQASMELGALICSPRNPNCDQCPVSRFCRAHAGDLQEEIPGKVSRVSYEDRTEFAMVLSRPQPDRPQRSKTKSRKTNRSKASTNVADRQYLVRPLPEGRRWAGLWDFPRTTEASFDSVDEAASELSKEVGVKIAPGIRLLTIRHAVTKYRISLHVHAAELLDPPRDPGRPWRFATLPEIAELPMSVTGRKIAGLLENDRQTFLQL